MEFTKDQATCLNMIYDWYHNSDKEIFTMQGAAGTGKTTILKFVSAKLNVNVLFLAPTNKAAKVLNSKGVEAYTIHSKLYQTIKYNDSNWILKEIHALNNQPKTDLIAEQIKRFEYMLKQGLNMEFDLDESKCKEIIKKYGLIVLDEASMGSAAEEYPRLLRFLEIAKSMKNKIKILLVGDIFQLPPVSGRSLLDITGTDFALTEIVRQNADNPILKYATNIRNGKFICPSEMLVYDKFIDSYIENYNVINFENEKIITGQNKNVLKYNLRILDKLGINKTLIGVKIVASKMFQDDVKIYNGDEFEITNILEETEHYYLAELLADNGITISVQILKDTLYGTEPTYFPTRKDCAAFNFNYAITAHKSQGSEYSKVIVDVADDKYWLKKSGTYNNWLYTAVTRAKLNLHIKI